MLKNKSLKISGLTALSILTMGSTTALAGAAPMPSQEEMWEIIQKQSKEIAELKASQKKTAVKMGFFLIGNSNSFKLWNSRYCLWILAR